MFAIIRTGGKQYRVAEADLVTVDKIAGEPGDIVEFADVLMLGGEETVLGSPVVAGATVAGELVKQGRGGKIIAFKKRRRKNSRRKRGHRQEFSLVRITEILTEGRRPSARGESAESAEPAEAAAQAEAVPVEASPGPAPESATAEPLPAAGEAPISAPEAPTSAPEQAEPKRRRTRAAKAQKEASAEGAEQSEKPEAPRGKAKDES